VAEAVNAPREPDVSVGILDVGCVVLLLLRNARRGESVAPAGEAIRRRRVHAERAPESWAHRAQLVAPAGQLDLLPLECRQPRSWPPVSAFSMMTCVAQADLPAKPRCAGQSVLHLALDAAVVVITDIRQPVRRRQSDPRRATRPDAPGLFPSDRAGSALARDGRCLLRWPLTVPGLCMARSS
jgi:hypothetical protein